jgi:hypothetical protein
MTLDKRHMAGSVLMLVGALAYNVWVFTRPATRLSAAAAPVDMSGAPSTAPETGEPRVASEAPPLPDVELGRLPHWGRDPFEDMHDVPEVVETAAPTPPPVVQADPVVASILYSTGRRLAVIDGRIVRLNEHVGDATVIDIQPKAVVLEFADGERRTVALQAPSTGRRRR